MSHVEHICFHCKREFKTHEEYEQHHRRSMFRDKHKPIRTNQYIEQESDALICRIAEMADERQARAD